MSDAPLVLTEIDPDGFAVLTLNRPAAMNALSTALMASLAGALDNLARDSRVRVLILTGAGRAFCAGLDLKELGSGQAQLGQGEKGGAREDPVAALERFRGPVIGAINGPAVTGGFELALSCDILLASTSARFADTHARVGVAPGWGLSQRLPRVIGPYRARELSFTGRWLEADQARDWGLVNRVVAPEDLLPTAVAMAREMLDAVPEMLLHYKRVIGEGYALPFGAAMDWERAEARTYNAQVTSGALEQRREGVRQRNRST